MRGLKFDLTVTIAVLLSIGMLLTDFVIMGLWQYHANQASREKLEHLLALTAASIQDASPPLVPGQNILAELERQRLCLHIVPAGKGADRPIRSCAQEVHLAPIVEAALRDGQKTARQVDRRGQAEWSGKKWLVVAQPLYQGENLIGAVGLSGPRTTLFDLMAANQQHVLVYLLINAIILTVIGFFRISRQVIRPLERLITVADNYQAQERVLFSSQNQSNEISQLSASLNSVVQRIEYDKSVLKQTVAELARKNKQLQENQQEMVRAEKLASVGRLAAGLAHEIGNPLGVAQGYLQLLGMDGSGEDERTEYVGRALKELERVDGLIRQLLDYARTSKGEPQRFDAQELLAELAATLKVQPFLQGIRLDLALEAGNALVFADPEQVRQVILNCLINAADAIKGCREDGSGAIVMATALVAPSKQKNDLLLLQIAIEDNGAGVNPELLDTVFDPFFTTKEPGAGTGLGLSVSLALLESMGGTIRLQSVEGEGTTVLLLLPLAAEAAAGSAAFLPENNDGCVDPPGGQQC
jgi:two-component system NtrC family sensor kinase